MIILCCVVLKCVLQCEGLSRSFNKASVSRIVQGRICVKRVKKKKTRLYTPANVSSQDDKMAVYFIAYCMLI